MTVTVKKPSFLSRGIGPVENVPSHHSVVKWWWLLRTRPLGKP
jgi:hypothetical protein